MTVFKLRVFTMHVFRYLYCYSTDALVSQLRFMGDTHVEALEMTESEYKAIPMNGSVYREALPDEDAPARLRPTTPSADEEDAPE